MTTGNLDFTDYEDIQEYIREARLERSIAIGNMIGAGVDAAWRGLKALGAAATETLVGAREVRSINPDAFINRVAHR